MGRRGPIPKASAGQAQHVGAGVPPAPDSISERAKKHYADLADLLAGRLEHEDEHMVAICAQCLAEIEDMNQVLRSDGYFIESDKGGTYPHPAINIRSMAHKQFKEAAAQLGLSPAARHRLTGALNNGSEAAGGPADFDAEHGGSDSA